MDDPVSPEAPALESLLSPASSSGVQVTSKSRRRRKAKQASRARKDAAGDGESSGSITEPSSAEIQPVEKVCSFGHDWLIVRSIDHSIDGLIDWLNDHSFDCLIDWRIQSVSFLNLPTLTVYVDLV